MENQFLGWLNNQNCLEDLLSCAKMVIRRAETLGITLDDSYMAGGDPKTYHIATATKLWEFLRDKVESLTHKATSFIVKNDEKGLANFIVQEFIDSCIDKRRNDSPLHAYYRHMRTVLSKADKINYKSIPRKASYYAWSHAKNLEILPEDYTFQAKNLKYEEWSASTIPFSDIYNKSPMTLLSQHYWDEALRIIHIEYFLSIRGLVTFISTKYPLISKVEYESGMVGRDGDAPTHNMSSDKLIDQADSFPDDAWTRQLPVLARSIIENDLNLIAQNCAAKLTTVEKAVLCGLDDSMTLANVACSLGMKGPSNVSYHRKKAEEKLREAWSLWGQPDSDHYSVIEAEQEIFFEKIIQICKRVYTYRDSREEECP